MIISLLRCKHFSCTIHRYRVHHMNYILGADLSNNIPFVFLRLKAPLWISVCMLFLLVFGMLLTLTFMLVAPFTWWVAWSGEVLTEFHFEVPLLTATWDFAFIFSCTLTLPTVFSFALNASRNDWFCNMTSGVENLLASFLSSEMRLLLCDDPPEVNVEFSKWRLEGELLLLKLQEETRWYNHWVYVDIFVHKHQWQWFEIDIERWFVTYY